ncbi:SPFH domain-containing protein [Luteibacter sp. W1I16]|uniref:SPFH domain-containing protein n=1 Tax=Luteibacter sp. W1I16 TaxID=3373922 RepID=UPI003D1A3D89
MRSMVYPQLPSHPLLAHMTLAGRRARARFDTIDWAGDWAPGLLAALGNILVLNALAGFLRSPGWADTPPPMWAAVLLLASTIPLVFFQRFAASMSPKDGPGVEVLVRVPLVTCLAGGSAALFAAQGYVWANLALYPVGVVIGLAACECILRAVMQLFVPLGPAQARHNPALPWLPSLLRLSWPRPGRATRWLREAYGIDLAGSWVLAFLVRAAFPVGLFVLLLAWLSSAVTVLGVSERAVVERLGVPVAVVGPGLHVHLPWPFGRARTVEFGVVHPLPIVFSAKPGGRLLAELASAGATEAEGSMGAEAIPGPTADRLWDGSHPGEASYLIASRSGDREGFQVVNVDLRVVFRVMDNDEGAMASVYAATDPASLVRATAGRLLVTHFSSSTLDELLGENRARFVDRFRDDIQARVGAFHAGISIINVVVEAIHPPSGAASAYHNVQAAGIRSDAMRFQSQARAFALRGTAAQDEARNINQSRAEASEKLGDAQATLNKFQASTKSLRVGPDVFVFESWLAHVGDALNRTHLTIIDHRLDSEKATLDLRPVAAGTGGTL